MMGFFSFRAKLVLPFAVLCLSFAACGSDDDGSGNGSAAEKNENRNAVFDDNAATRVEVPHLRGGNSKFIVYRTSDKTFDKDGVNYCVEWDRDLKANRWTCYILTARNVLGNGQRWKGGYAEYGQSYRESETSDKSVYIFDLKNLSLDDYYHYDDYGATHCYIHKARGFDHGHLCNSNDRTYNGTDKKNVGEINKQTFYITNMQPQYSVFNGSDRNYKYKGLWLTMEKFVNDFPKGNKFAADDTLFVCKGGTIDRADQILKRIDGKLIVPKYFYAALVWKRTSQNLYSGIAFWFEHTDVYHGDDALRGYAISISELEKKLENNGQKIDFFCNLPDRIENKVEKTAALLDFGL